MGYNVLTDEQLIHDTMKRMQDQHQLKGEEHWTVQTPCCHINFEIPKTHMDTYLTCDCGHKYLLTHSTIGFKLYGE